MQINARFIFYLLFAFMGTTISGQDLIHLKNGKTLDVFIKSIESNHVYYFENNDTLVTHSILQSKVSSIERELRELNPKKRNNNIQQIKVEIFGLSVKRYSIAYERCINTNSTIEPYFAVRRHDNESGYEGGARVKMFMRRSRFKEKIDHAFLSGNYAFLLFGYGQQKRVDDLSTPTIDRGLIVIDKAFIGGIGFGNQWQFGNFCLDGNAGYVFYQGTSEQSIDEESPTKYPLTKYENGLLIANDNRGFFISYALGYNF